MVSRLLRLDKYSIYFRYLEVNALKFSEFNLQNQSRTLPSLEILFVSTAKDFSILKSAIKFAADATLHHDNVTFHIVVPGLEVAQCQLSLADLPLEFYVLAEESIIENELLRRLRSRFGARAGWVIQQLAKVAFVMSSKAPGVFVIDSDTLLLEPRIWLDHDGIQLLTPTWEFHSPYYKFLHSKGVSRLRPKYTFVSHHMLMQPKILREAFATAGWATLNELVDSLVSIPGSAEESPFCIEYELYAQYMMSRYPQLIRLEKWSNIGFSRRNISYTEVEKVVIPKFKGGYASVSLHSYL